jgi:ribonuclease E
MKRMLINATQPEELRVAIVDGQQLNNLDIEVPSKAQKKANIYKGKITRVEPSLEAAFVEFGSERHGFLPFKEIARQYFKTKEAPDGGKVSIKDAIAEGQELIVQVEKEERGNKGAALTTFISLAGRYLVLMPNNPRAGGISRRVEGDERADLREALSTLDIPAGMGLIVRTAGVGRVADELQWDLDYLLKAWSAIENAANENKAPLLIYQESNLIVRAIRDYFSQDLNEVLIDDPEVCRQAREFVELVMPENLRKIKLYDDPVPLFNRYQIESRIETAFQHDVRLPSGGSIVIDHTEALVAVDINSARATKGSDIEETAFNTNLEAADEIARQLRLRDLGGLIVIDFIDMTPAKNQREVENRLREALKRDRARVQIGRISRFGLLEMSRQRLRPSLGESHLMVCPRCTGQGVVRSTESLAFSILRLLEEEAMKEKTGKVMVRVPLQVGTFLLNEKRDAIQAIEQRNHISIIMVPDPNVESPHHDIQRIRSDDDEHEVHNTVSYDLVEATETVPEFVTAASVAAAKVQEPVVKSIAPPSPAPVVAAPVAAPLEREEGVLKRMWTTLFGGAQAPASTDSDSNSEPRKPARRNGNSDERGGNGDSRRRTGRRGSGNRDESRANQGDRSSARKRSNEGGDKPKGRGENAERGAETRAKNEESQNSQDNENANTTNNGERRRSRRKPRGDNRDNTPPTELKPTDGAEPVSADASGDLVKTGSAPIHGPSDSAENDAETTPEKASLSDGTTNDGTGPDGDESEQPKRTGRSRRGRRGGRGRRKSADTESGGTNADAESASGSMQEFEEGAAGVAQEVDHDAPTALRKSDTLTAPDSADDSAPEQGTDAHESSQAVAGVGDSKEDTPAASSRPRRSRGGRGRRSNNSGQSDEAAAKDDNAVASERDSDTAEMSTVAADTSTESVRHDAPSPAPVVAASVSDSENSGSPAKTSTNTADASTVAPSQTGHTAAEPQPPKPQAPAAEPAATPRSEPVEKPAQLAPETSVSQPSTAASAAAPAPMAPPADSVAPAAVTAPKVDAGSFATAAPAATQPPIAPPAPTAAAAAVQVDEGAKAPDSPSAGQQTNVQAPPTRPKPQEASVPAAVAVAAAAADATPSVSAKPVVSPEKPSDS